MSKDLNSIEKSAWSWLNLSSWLWPFCLSNKFKFAAKVALSLTLAYLIPMAMGWPQASTAATTVMLIASTASRRESLALGTYRIIGTVIGGVIGLLLVGIFAQDRLIYMFVVSVVVSAIFYFRNAYQKDPSVFMLTGVMVLMMSNGGNAEGAFIYGIDRVFMTAFGVVIFSMVSVFIFPAKTEQNLKELAHELNRVQRQIFNRLSQGSGAGQALGVADGNEELPLSSLIAQLFKAQADLEQRYASISAECSDVSAYKKEWQLALLYNKQITELLIFVANSASQSITDNTAVRTGDKRVSNRVDLALFIEDYQKFVDKISLLFNESDLAWGVDGKAGAIIEDKVIVSEEALTHCTHLQKGEVLTFAYVMNQLHEKLSRLTATIASIDSVTDQVPFKEVFPKALSSFIWWDAENAKTAIKVFVTYWVAGFIWIYFNPPGGYSFVIFSVIYMSLLSFIPVHPVMLLVLFTFGFLFAVPSYLFILPSLTAGAELGGFIFIYTFIAFYLFKGPVTMFFLMGLFVLGIDNTMHYNFAVLITVMLLFYLVVLMIILPHYFPFSSRPEHLFIVMKERFFRHAAGVIQSHRIVKPSRLQKLIASWHLMTMNITVKKLTLWSSKINSNHFTQTRPEAFKALCASSELLSNHLTLFVSAENRFATNKLILHGCNTFKDTEVVPMVLSMASGSEYSSLDSQHEGDELNHASTEEQLTIFLNQTDLNQYSQTEISGFYIFLNLKRNVFDAIGQCKRAYRDISWNELQQTRF